MRHGNKILKIGRNASHRKATLQSMSAALIEHKRITTTLGKARALRRFVEPIITRAKDDSTHGRRQAFRRLQDKEAVKTLYDEVAEKVGDRPGGYTRIVKLGQRAGDAAEMAIVELVDFNDVKPDGSKSSSRKTRRSRRKSGNNTAPTVKAASTAPTASSARRRHPGARRRGRGRLGRRLDRGRGDARGPERRRRRDDARRLRCRPGPAPRRRPPGRRPGQPRPRPASPARARMPRTSAGTTTTARVASLTVSRGPVPSGRGLSSFVPLPPPWPRWAGDGASASQERTKTERGAYLSDPISAVRAFLADARAPR